MTHSSAQSAAAQPLDHHGQPVTPAAGASRPPRVGDRVLVIEGDEGSSNLVPTGTIGTVTEVNDEWLHQNVAGEYVHCSRVAWKGGPVASFKLPGVWVDNASLQLLHPDPAGEAPAD